MHVITPAEQQGSGHCFVCERGIDRHTQTMALDTLYDIELPGHFLDGRKYICQGCVSDVVRACGLMQANEVETLQARLKEFQLGYQHLLDEVTGHIVGLSNELTQVPVIPDVSFARPNDLMVAREALDNAKPKRGRPAKEPF